MGLLTESSMLAEMTESERQSATQDVSFELLQEEALKKENELKPVSQRTHYAKEGFLSAADSFLGRTAVVAPETTPETAPVAPAKALPVGIGGTGAGLELEIAKEDFQQAAELVGLQQQDLAAGLQDLQEAQKMTTELKEAQRTALGSNLTPASPTDAVLREMLGVDSTMLVVGTVALLSVVLNLMQIGRCLTSFTFGVKLQIGACVSAGFAAAVFLKFFNEVPLSTNLAVGFGVAFAFALSLFWNVNRCLLELAFVRPRKPKTWSAWLLGKEKTDEEPAPRPSWFSWGGSASGDARKARAEDPPLPEHDMSMWSASGAAIHAEKTLEMGSTLDMDIENEFKAAAMQLMSTETSCGSDSPEKLVVSVAQKEMDIQTDPEPEPVPPEPVKVEEMSIQTDVGPGLSKPVGLNVVSRHEKRHDTFSLEFGSESPAPQCLPPYDPDRPASALDRRTRNYYRSPHGYITNVVSSEHEVRVQQQDRRGLPPLGTAPGMALQSRPAGQVGVPEYDKDTAMTTKTRWGPSAPVPAEWATSVRGAEAAQASTSAAGDHKEVEEPPAEKKGPAFRMRPAYQEILNRPMVLGRSELRTDPLFFKGQH
ncbi:hypothetical protein CYMTET_17291 [Cymbomonas tetramitiformis]|uniref:Uncharacterized protein n=1 Tax=Cymbomonas tetramitiformis TaxID=36881 RepID=A0AAE0GAE0_9CHLO|nr:hypothetical protein CYMTET_17291 [Cymbomonas tetramitiformis]